MSDNQLAVEVVRGEMQPWSDYNGKRGAVGGPALRTLLNDVLPAGARTLILGPHTADLVSVVASKTADLTMLVRSVSDAADLAEQCPTLQVIAGALDGLSATSYDAVVAVDGLDRVLGYDSDDLTWAQRLDALAALCAPSTVLVLGLENEFSLTNLLDSRPPSERHGDDEWRPLHEDPTRPVSPVQLASELERVGLPLQTVYASYSDHALLAVDVAAAARPGTLPARLATEALQTTDVPLLAPVAEAADTAARAGLLASTATGWLAVTTTAKHAIYTNRLTLDPADTNWSITTPLGADTSATGASATPAAAASGDGSATAALSVRGVSYDVSAFPSVVSGGVSVETLLFRLAAAEDVPAFRALAERLGEWALAQPGQVILRWDDIVVDGDSFGFGVSGWVAEAGRAELLAAAWVRLHDRLIGTHRRHPWPPWMVGDDLVATWLAMSMSGAAGEVARGKELAGALATALGEVESAAPDVRTALADAERAKQELFELQGHVFGLERTLGFRDKALKTRETRLREMRLQVQKANAERTRFRNSRAFAAATLIRKAATIRNPRKFAYKVKRSLRRSLRNRLG